MNVAPFAYLVSDRNKLRRGKEDLVNMDENAFKCEANDAGFDTEDILETGRSGSFMTELCIGLDLDEVPW